MKEQFFAKLAELVALAKNFPPAAFDEAAPEETTKHRLIRPLLKSLGYEDANIVPEFKIVGDQVDYLLKSHRPLLFLEAKSLIDVSADLFEGNKPQVLRYLRNYRVSPEQAHMEWPVAWIVLTNFNQWHFIRVTEEKPSFSFKLNELIPNREKLWELLARENVEANRIEELYDQSHKAELDKRFLADLKRWRLLIANGFAVRNQKRSLDEITLASQQLLDRFIFCRMLETYRLIEWNKLARAYMHYDEVFGSFDGKTFAEFLRESLFQEIKFKFNTELFQQPLLCDELAIDNEALATVIGHEPLHAELAAHCRISTGQGELFPFRHLYLYDFSRMSQDIMGAVYERFLAHRLLQDGGRVVIEDTDELRKKEGIYYTPRYIVDYIVAHTLGEKVKPILAEALTLLGYKNYKAAARKICVLGQIKVLDPAMGSGSFLLRAFDTLVKAYEDYNLACRKAKAERTNGSGMLFDAAGEIAEEIDHLGIRVATENIFGVDLDAQAIEVAKLNLWMRLMAVERDFIRAELQRRGRASRAMNFLPDLRKNLRRGNSLIADKMFAGDAAFDWQTKYPETMKHGGFDVVIGNPPYHMLQPHNTNQDVLEYLRTQFVQAEFKIDLFHLFLQRGIALVRNEGRMGFIVPTSILNNVYVEGLRRWLLDQSCVERISVCNEQVFADADVHTTVLVLRRELDTAKRAGHEILTTTELNETNLPNGITYSRTRQSRFTETAGCVWNILLNEENARLIRRLQSGFKQLKTIARINRGLVTGDRARYFTETKKSDAYIPIIEGGNVFRYCISPISEFVLFQRPERAGGCWDPDVHLAPHKIVIRQIGQAPIASLLREPVAVTANVFTIRVGSLDDEMYVLGILNSRLTQFFWRTMFSDFKISFPQVTAFSLEQLPIKVIDETDKKHKKAKEQFVISVSRILQIQSRALNIPIIFRRTTKHSNRAPCNLAHYLQNDFADAVKAETLIDDVQREGFVHEIHVVSAGSQITFSATVADDTKFEAKPLPILRLEFKHEPLRQFIYALWRQFLDENSRKKKWTAGKKPEAVYSLLVNTLEPLMYFQPAAVDNLRSIRDLMKNAEKEAGSADLAALEAEIEALDREIDERVYELYSLTPEEIKIVEQAR